MSKWSSYPKAQLITENWRRYINEQEAPEAPVPPNGQAPQAQAEAPGTDLEITDQTSFKVFKNNPKLAALVMNELLKGGDLFKTYRLGMGLRSISLLVRYRLTKAAMDSRPERATGHTGTEIRPRLLREAAVRNIAQWPNG